MSEVIPLSAALNIQIIQIVQNPTFHQGFDLMLEYFTAERL